jgi:hypothetical protein
MSSAASHGQTVCSRPETGVLDEQSTAAVESTGVRLPTPCRLHTYAAWH